MSTLSPVDLFVVGGGINGTGIARDAAGRGLSVALCEQNDLAGQTSSASSKMIHGGLRYLEHWEFRLVREALEEREVLLRKAPHLIDPLRLILPHTPAARPAWMISAGLFLYDHLGRRQSLPGSTRFNVKSHPAGAVLKPEITRAHAYSDCRVDDSRLVVANALSARGDGVDILTRHRLVRAERQADRWHLWLQNTANGETRETQARALVNAAGAQVEKVLNTTPARANRNRVRLVKGSHIVVPRVFDGPEAFLLQNHDGRVIFVIPFEQSFSLIGTTDIPVETPEEGTTISAAETTYLCDAVNDFFRKTLTPEDVVWAFAGVRPLFDDGEQDPSAVTRDYVLELDAANGAPPVLSVFGGKITTYRRLAESALDKLAPHFPGLPGAWTADTPLAGGDLDAPNLSAYAEGLAQTYPELPVPIIQSLVRRHGALTPRVLGDARTASDLGMDFGGGLTAREVDYLITEEWAETVDDIIWRRTKTGMHMNPAKQRQLEGYLAHRAPVAA